MQIASHLKRPLGETMETVSSSEFWKWKITLERERTALTATQQYLARIAFEIKATKLAQGQEINLSDFYLSFQKEEETLPPEERMKRSKSVWKAIAAQYGTKPKR